VAYNSILGGRRAPKVEKTLEGSLEDAVATFATNPVSAVSAIRRLHGVDPFRLALAAARMVLSNGEKSSGRKYVTGLVTGGSLLTELFLNSQVLPLAAAAALARKLAELEPRLDTYLLRNAAATAGGELRSIDKGKAMRVLELLDAISDCSRLASYLVQLIDHADAKVRSKAALLLGRANWNHTRVESLLASDDSRARANAVESLWGRDERDVNRILWEATQDHSGRVVINALVGLCRAGDRQAYSHLTSLAKADKPVLRSGAAWAMGEIGDPEFGGLLEKLEQDSDDKVRAMARKSRAKLRPSAVVAPPPSQTPASSAPDPSETVPQETVPDEDPTTPQNHVSYVRIS